MSAVPAWLQILAHVAAILASVLGILFGALVLWPSIRRQNSLAVKFLAFLDKADQKAVDKLLENL